MAAGDSPSLVGGACTRHDVAAGGVSKTKRDQPYRLLPITEVGLPLFTRVRDALTARPNLKPVQCDIGTDSRHKAT